MNQLSCKFTLTRVLWIQIEVTYITFVLIEAVQLIELMSLFYQAVTDEDIKIIVDSHNNYRKNPRTNDTAAMMCKMVCIYRKGHKSFLHSKNELQRTHQTYRKVQMSQITGRKGRWWFHRCLSVHRGVCSLDRTPLWTETTPPPYRDP